MKKNEMAQRPRPRSSCASTHVYQTACPSVASVARSVCRSLSSSVRCQFFPPNAKLMEIGLMSARASSRPRVDLSKRPYIRPSQRPSIRPYPPPCRTVPASVHLRVGLRVAPSKIPNPRSLSPALIKTLEGIQKCDEVMSGEKKG